MRQAQRVSCWRLQQIRPIRCNHHIARHGSDSVSDPKNIFFVIGYELDIFTWGPDRLFDGPGSAKNLKMAKLVFTILLCYYLGR